MGTLLLATASLWCFAPAVAGTKNPPAQVQVQENPINRDLKAPLSFAPIAKKVGPSVVNIYSTMTIKQRANPLLDDPFFRRFFGDQGDDQKPQSHRAQSLGSGVIVSPDGYILTANHVVQGADKVKVSLSTGEKEFEAKVIGTDPPTDIAVLKIQAKKTLPAITFGDSDKLEVGDLALAVGNPFGVGQTLTLGIISGLGRSGFGITGYEDFIQTDAAINPGNSGGALVDAEGRLIGINTAILSRSGGFQGVGFAVPVNLARFVMDRLITTGKVTRGYLGINIQPLTPELAKELDLPGESSGVLVGGVTPNSPAAKAGLQDGDVIVGFDGKKITEPRVLQLQVAQTSPGSKATLRVLRSEPGGQTEQKTLSVTLGQMPSQALAAMGGSEDNEQGQQQSGAADVLDGVEVTDIDAATRSELKIPKSIQGALVANVAPSSTAAEAGLHQGDVIVGLNRQPVHNADEAVALSEKVKGDNVLLRVWSHATGGIGGTHYIVVQNTANH